MVADPALLLLGGSLVLLVALIVPVALATRARRRREHLAKERQVTSPSAQDFTSWVEEGRQLFSRWQERIERHEDLESRLTAVTGELEQLRAETARLRQDNDSLQAERAEALQVFTTILEHVTRAAEQLRGRLGSEEHKRASR